MIAPPIPINEDTKPKPLSVYGKHKLEAELYALKDLSEVLVVRMAGFFGGREKDKNFVGKIVSQIARLVQDDESSIEIGNRIWQPTYTNDLALNCLLLLSEEKNGKYNMASHGQASFYELAKEIVSLLGIKNKIKIIPVDSSKFSKKEKAKRPLLALIENKNKNDDIKSIINNFINNLKEIEWVLGQPIDLLFSNEKEINLLHQSIKTRVDILCSSGAKGCSFNQIKVDAKEISVINTNGAGDALIGIFLSHYNLISQQEALKKAVDYATQVCLIGGPRI